ncbi:hypothetical protein M9458_029860, partial [Cirrhinus mrigala]
SASLMTLGPKTPMESCTVWSFWEIWWAAAERFTTTSPSSCSRKLLQIPSRLE